MDMRGLWPGANKLWNVMYSRTGTRLFVQLDSRKYRKTRINSLRNRLKNVMNDQKLQFEGRIGTLDLLMGEQSAAVWSENELFASSVWIASCGVNQSLSQSIKSIRDRNFMIDRLFIIIGRIELQIKSLNDEIRIVRGGVLVEWYLEKILNRLTFKPVTNRFLPRLYRAGVYRCHLSAYRSFVWSVFLDTWVIAFSLRLIPFLSL